MPWCLLIGSLLAGVEWRGGESRTAEGAEGEGLEWRSVAVTVRGRPILQQCSGTIGAGRLLGILGPSGAGKSTLMHVLAGALRAGGGVQATGDVHFTPSGAAIALSSGDVAFLPQAAALFPGLTVLETLELSARLHGRARAAHDAAAALGALGLTHAADMPVGERSAGGLRSGGGISGGECRRLAIGCAALLSVPRLLLADEPTSGLDAAAALRVVRQLRSIARARALPAALTLHQPRAAIFHALDDVLLLAPGGRVVYHGARDGAEGHFRALGHARPLDAGVAEWLVDLVAIDGEDPQAAATDRARVDTLVGAWHLRQAERERGAPAGLAARRPTLGRWGTRAAAPARVREQRPRFVQRLWLLTRRAATQRLRAWPLLATRALAAFALAHVLAAVYPTAVLATRVTAAAGVGPGGGGAGQRLLSLARVGGLLPLRAQPKLAAATRGARPGARALGGEWLARVRPAAVRVAPSPVITPASVADRITLLSFGAISIAFAGVSKTLTLVGAESAVVGHERALGLCGAVEYVCAKFAAEAPFDALVALVFAETLRSAGRLRMGRFEANGAFAAVALASTTLGLAVGALSPSAESALVAGVPLLVLHTILGVINPSGVPSDAPSKPLAMRAFAAASPIGAAIRALLPAELGGARLDRSGFALRHAPRLGALALVGSGDEVLFRLGLGADGRGRRAPSWRDGIIRLLLISAGNLAVAVAGALFTRPRFVEPRQPIE